MLSNSNYPRAFLDRLTSLDSIIKGVKKLMKLARKIQKKVFIIAPIMRHRVIFSDFQNMKFPSLSFNFLEKIKTMSRRLIRFILSINNKLKQLLKEYLLNFLFFLNSLPHRKKCITWWLCLIE